MFTVFNRPAVGALSRMLWPRMPWPRIPLVRVLAARALWAALPLALLQACTEPTGKADALDADGSWTFINYWAEWCKPCIKEIPELNTLHAIDGYRVLGVNFDGAQGEALRAQIDTLGVGFPTLDEDPGARFGLDKPEVLPTTLVLTPGGELHAVLIGPQTFETLIAATESGS